MSKYRRTTTNLLISGGISNNQLAICSMVQWLDGSIVILLDG